MPKTDCISTGEAAKILNISRSTVSRRFDAGLFRGKLNPITGERLIFRKSLFDFIREHDLPIDSSALQERKVLVVSSYAPLVQRARTMAEADDRLHIEVTEHGTDALMLSSQKPPDLMVLDETIQDITALSVMASLRRREDLRKLKILLCVPDGQEPSVGEAAEADGCVTRSEYLDERGTNETYQLLQMEPHQPSEEHEVLVGEHRRRWSRLPVNVPARIGVYRMSAPREHGWGQCVVRNISRGGAYVSKIRLDDHQLPGEPFRMLLEIDEAPLDQVRAHCQVVRLTSNGSLSAGLQFVRISKAGLQRIAALTPA